MQIDRSNYEIWLIDWLDGNLSEFHVEQLQAFLTENPDIQEEYRELSTFRLNPSTKSFTHKDHLKKNASEISESQFDYLCVAFLEKDLSSAQLSELKEIIDLDPEKKKSFELIQKMRLVPQDISYKQKKHLFRKTVVQKVIRLSYIGLSAAAIITLAFITYFSLHRTLPLETSNTAQNIAVDNTIKKPAVESVSDKSITEKKGIPAIIQNKNLSPVSQKKASVIKDTEKVLSLHNDSAAIFAFIPLPVPDKIPVNAQIDLKNDIINNNLITLKTSANTPQNDDGRSKLSRFIAKTFREKVLKDKSPEDTPLKGYEFAEAGVTGLNKLLGWEMALDKKNGENGELKSIYFSSKLLKFNTSVKKSEPSK